MKKRNKTNSWLAFKFLLGGILLLALVQILASHRLTTAGKLVAEIEAQAAKVRAENDRLVEDLDQQGALAVIYARAEELGFIPASQTLYLANEVPVALGR